MKRQLASQSAFFCLRVSIGLFLIMMGIMVGLMAIAPSGAQVAQKHQIITTSDDPLVPVGFDCSKIHELGMDRQENLRAGAIMIACGQASGGSPTSDHPASSAGGSLMQTLLAPLTYGAGDVDLITGTETFSNVTQSETFTLANPDNPNQVFVAYNDSRGRNVTPINISGASFSTDGGTTFTRLTKATGQSPFDNTLGDPVGLYHKPTGTWLTVWLDGACGGQGLGGYKSTNPSDANSWTHFCVHNNSLDDRESGWADNNPASPFYGHLYISWNDFNVGGGALYATSSTDGGLTWHAPVQVSNGSPFIRDVQITGDLSGNGTIYLAGMDEGGGGYPHNNVNHLFKSTDGGNTWSHPYTGTAFAGPGVIAVGYFACMFPDNGGYWRHEGWGEPAAYNNVVHLVYAQHGVSSDAGDIYYIRSTDGGVTFASPFKLNSDTTTRPQWQPNISVSAAGTVLATWYDGRDSTACTYGNSSVPCYKMYSRKSLDNGATWLPDDAFSDVVSPLPAQPDPGIQATYAGDYDYGSALISKHLSSWTDGRVTISSTAQQDAFTDREVVGFSVSTAIPACGSVVIGTPPTDFVLNLTDPVNPATVQASDFTVNGIAADSFTLGGGNAQITFHFNSSPAVTQGLQTMHLPAGAINRASDNASNLDFTCTFRWDATLLQVTTTVPAVGGTFSPPAPGDYTYDVNFNEAVDPTSVQASDLAVSGSATPSVTAVSVINANTTVEFTVHFAFGGTFSASIAAGAITDGFGNPGAAFAGSYNVQGCPPQQYVITDGTDTIVPGTLDTGNHCDDCDTFVALPFSFNLYDHTYTSVNVDSNGRLDFSCANESGGYLTTCLPAGSNICSYDYTIFGLWHDLRTDIGLTGCSSWTNGCGIFTSVSGTAPNRIFNIEWHAVEYANPANRASFEIRLYENPAGNRFDIIYGASPSIVGLDTGGVQGNSAAGFFTEDFCNTAPPQNASRAYTIPTCATTANLVSAASRLTHGSAGSFDISMPLTGTSGVEDRNGGGNYLAVFSFDAPVTSGVATVVSGVGTAGTPVFSGNEMRVPLTGVADQQVVTVEVANINGAGGANDVPFGFLIADITGNRKVDKPDLTQVNTNKNQPVNAGNFRDDINLSGVVDKPDHASVNTNRGHILP